MSAAIDQAFITQFDTEIKLAYQRMGSKLSNTVRRKANVKGSKTDFRKAGTGTAGTKTRHGLVPLMQIGRSLVDCTLEDHYAADYVDKMDELKSNQDERKIVSDTAAGALGRKSDDILVDAMDAGAGNTRVAGGTGLTEAKVLAEQEAFGNAEIPDDGQRYWLIPPEGWSDLLGIPSFAQAEFIGSDDLPWKGGMSAKRYASFMFIPYTGLRAGSGGATEVATLAYHTTAVGHASGQDVTSEVNYVAERVAHLLNSMLSQGACVIDPVGCRQIDIVK